MYAIKEADPQVVAIFSWKEATCELCPVLLNERKLFLSSPFHWEERNRKSKKEKKEKSVSMATTAGWLDGQKVKR